MIFTIFTNSECWWIWCNVFSKKWFIIENKWLFYICFKTLNHKKKYLKTLIHISFRSWIQKGEIPIKTNLKDTCFISLLKKKSQIIFHLISRFFIHIFIRLIFSQKKHFITNHGLKIFNSLWIKLI